MEECGSANDVYFLFFVVVFYSNVTYGKQHCTNALGLKD